jgi:hypothetical protein
MRGGAGFAANAPLVVGAPHAARKHASSRKQARTGHRKAKSIEQKS